MSSENVNMTIKENVGSNVGSNVGPSQEIPTNPLKRPLTVVFCVSGANFSNHFLVSWTDLMMYCATHQIRPVISCSHDTSLGRNILLNGSNLAGTQQLPFQGKLDYDFIMWIDNHHVFTPAHFESLLRRDKEVVSGLSLVTNDSYSVAVNHDMEYWSKHGSLNLLKRNELEQWVEKNCIGTPEEKKVEKTGQMYKDYSKCSFPLMNVSYSNMGWMLVKKGVIEKLPYPWFRHGMVDIEVKNKDDGSVKVISDVASQEYNFCQQLSKLGIPMYVDIQSMVATSKTNVF